MPARQLKNPRTSKKKPIHPMPEAGNIDMFEANGEAFVWKEDAARWINDHLMGDKRQPGMGRPFKLARSAGRHFCDKRKGCVVLGRALKPTTALVRDLGGACASRSYFSLSDLQE